MGAPPQQVFPASPQPRRATSSAMNSRAECGAGTPVGGFQEDILAVSLFCIFNWTHFCPGRAMPSEAPTEACGWGSEMSPQRPSLLPQLPDRRRTPWATSPSPAPVPAQGLVGEGAVIVAESQQGAQWPVGAPPGGTDGVIPESPPHCPWCFPAATVAPAPPPNGGSKCRGLSSLAPQEGCGRFSPGQGSLLTPANRLWALPSLPSCWQKDGHILFPDLLTQAESSSTFRSCKGQWPACDRQAGRKAGRLRGLGDGCSLTPARRGPVQAGSADYRPAEAGYAPRNSGQ